jgi:hypothetical protein
LRENIFSAARLRVFIPPHLICLDEAKKGRSTRRVGLSRLKEILQCLRSLVLVMFKLSRLFRSSYKGYEFITERVVEKGHRAVAFNDGSCPLSKAAYTADAGDRRSTRQWLGTAEKSPLASAHRSRAIAREGAASDTAGGAIGFTCSLAASICRPARGCHTPPPAGIGHGVDTQTRAIRTGDTPSQSQSCVPHDPGTLKVKPATISRKRWFFVAIRIAPRRTGLYHLGHLSNLRS